MKNPSRAISCVYNQMLPVLFWFSSYINDSKLSYCIVPFIIVLFVRIASFLIGSLRSHSYTIYFTHLKFTIYWTLKYAQSCGTITTVNFRTFSLPPKETSYPFVVTPVSPPLLIWAPGNPNRLSASIDLLLLNISDEWTHAVCGLLCLLLFT